MKPSYVPKRKPPKEKQVSLPPFDNDNNNSDDDENDRQKKHTPQHSRKKLKKSGHKTRKSDWREDKVAASRSNSCIQILSALSSNCIFDVFLFSQLDVCLNVFIADFTILCVAWTSRRRRENVDQDTFVSLHSSENLKAKRRKKNSRKFNVSMDVCAAKREQGKKMRDARSRGSFFSRSLSLRFFPRSDCFLDFHIHNEDLDMVTYFIKPYSTKSNSWRKCSSIHWANDFIPISCQSVECSFCLWAFYT